MGNEAGCRSYTLGALALAKSIRNYGVDDNVDLVVMISAYEGSTFPKECIVALNELFDNVIMVDIIDREYVTKKYKRFGEMYNWLNKSFTKFRIFELTQYEKVAFLDADMIAMENTMGAFDYDVPAGICTSIKAKDQNKMNNKLVPKSLVLESLNTDYGMRGCFWIVKPDRKEFINMLRFLNQYTKKTGQKFGKPGRHVGPDEEFLTEYYMTKWHHVHAKYGCTAWKDDLLINTNPVFLHYVTEKPWISPSTWDDFKKWNKIGVQLWKEHPKTHSLFSEELKKKILL
jgi:lipopolysaccharide biosynthesis glycosyltransferase